MCDRDHQPEPGMSFGGMPLVICDDVPSGGVMLPKINWLAANLIECPGCGLFLGYSPDIIECPNCTAP